MKMKFFTFCAVLLIYACSNNSPDDLSTIDLNPEESDPTEILTYETDIKAIVDNNCIRCHGNPPTQAAPFPLTTFESVRDRIDRIIIRSNSISNPMPPNGLIAETMRSQFQQWKDDGLLEN